MNNLRAFFLRLRAFSRRDRLPRRSANLTTPQPNLSPRIPAPVGPQHCCAPSPQDPRPVAQGESASPAAFLLGSVSPAAFLLGSAASIPAFLFGPSSPASFLLGPSSPLWHSHSWLCSWVFFSSSPNSAISASSALSLSLGSVRNPEVLS
jgi:hypothetical protein